MILHAILGLSPLALAALFAVFVFGGLVKGVTGVGLPLVLVPLTTQFVDVPVAVALVSVSMVATNVVQSAEAGHIGAAVRHLLPILIPLAVGAVIGTHLLISIDRRKLNLIIGVSFLLLATLLLCLPRLRMSARTARWSGPFVGFRAGGLRGVSAVFGPPMIAYMVTLGTHPHTFVKRMPILALTAATPLLLLLRATRPLPAGDLLIP